MSGVSPEEVSISDHSGALGILKSTGSHTEAWCSVRGLHESRALLKTVSHTHTRACSAVVQGTVTQTNAKDSMGLCPVQGEKGSDEARLVGKSISWIGGERSRVDDEVADCPGKFKPVVCLVSWARCGQVGIMRVGPRF